MIDSTQVTISFGTAMHHCAYTGSYWLSLGILLVCLAIAWIVLEVEAKNHNFDPSNIEKALGVVSFLLIMLFIFARPCEVSVNTSLAEAAKGLWLGY